MANRKMGLSKQKLVEILAKGIEDQKMIEAIATAIDENNKSLKEDNAADVFGDMVDGYKDRGIRL